MGGLVCHCPCHGLRRRLDLALAKLADADARIVRLLEERHGLTLRIIDLEGEVGPVRALADRMDRLDSWMRQQRTVAVDRIDDGPHVNFEG
jgi:hypothetical protein